MAVEVQLTPATVGPNQTEKNPRQPDEENRMPLMSNDEKHEDDASKLKLRDSADIIENTNAVLKRQNAGSKQTNTDNIQSFDGIIRSQNIEPSAMVFLATFGALLGAVSMGLALGYTAPAFIDMENELSNGESILDPDPDKRESQKSLIGSTLAIGALIAAISSEPCNNLLGRRIPLIFCGIPFVIGWLLLTFANKLAYLVLGRLIIGACCGIACSTAPTYVVEIAPPQIRGALGTCFQLMVVIGNLLASIFGIFMSWRMLAAVSLIPGIGMTTMMLFLPESPTWLVDKQRREQAKQALQRFRSGPVDAELEEMIQAKTKQQQESDTSVYSYGILTSPEFLRPLGFGLGLMFFQQFSGVNAVLMYQGDIFKKASPNADPVMSTIWVCLAQVIATAACSLFVDKLGRRLLLWISGAGCMVTLASLGTYSYLALGDQTFQQDFASVPLVSLIIFITFYSFGFGPIPWMMIPELSTPRVRSLIASLGALFAWTGAYILTASLKPLMGLIGDAWTYWILAIICASSILFIIILPETKAKTHSNHDYDDRT